MHGSGDSNLSTGESAIYDRQIRLWGSSAQLRIKSSKVLLIGLTAAAVEIAKNTVLAGASVVLEDTRGIDESSTNFLIQLEVADTTSTFHLTLPTPSSHVDLTVAQATAFALHRLNEHPLVEFRKPDFSKHQLDASISAVVVSLSYLHYDVSEALAISKQARAMGIAFFAIIDSMNVSWMFSDFGKSHIVDAHTPPLKRDERTGERASLTNKIEEFEFCDFSTYVTSPVNDKYWVNKPSFPSEVFLFVHFFLKFHSSRGHDEKDPSPKRTRRDRSFASFVEEQLTEAATLSPRVAKYLGTRTSSDFAAFLVQEYETQLFVPSLPHIAAIHGALVTQEVIKFVTKKDPPLVNSIVIHNRECSAIVVKQPPTLSSKIISSDHAQDDGEDDIEIVTGGNNVVLD